MKGYSSNQLVRSRPAVLLAPRQPQPENPLTSASLSSKGSLTAIQEAPLSNLEASYDPNERNSTQEDLKKNQDRSIATCRDL